MSTSGPNIIIVAGPHGAGKTTAAADILVGALAVHEFVNADVIAKGLSAFQPESVAFDAGRIMLQRLHHLTETVRKGHAPDPTTKVCVFDKSLRLRRALQA